MSAVGPTLRGKDPNVGLTDSSSRSARESNLKLILRGLSAVSFADSAAATDSGIAMVYLPKQRDGEIDEAGCRC